MSSNTLSGTPPTPIDVTVRPGQQFSRLLKDIPPSEHEVLQIVSRDPLAKENYRGILDSIQTDFPILNTIKKKWVPFMDRFHYIRWDVDTIYIQGEFQVGDFREADEWKKGGATVCINVNNQWKLMELVVWIDGYAYDINVRKNKYDIIDAGKFELFTLKCDLNMPADEM
jgi:hypothetical protein